MNIINRAVDWLVDSFGGFLFLVLFNSISVLWVTLGLVDPHFFDPFPGNFYTLTVSWLAINMSILILWAERRNKAREERQKQIDLQRAIKDREQAEQVHRMTEAILNLSEGTQQIISVLMEHVEEDSHDINEILEAVKPHDSEVVK
ncbi:DUF1003 domain-containing protein [Alicyclobacillus dauci]|uniref:DUF1003 domain-containing protein n=1 Tax=Alicyclobacillus dauci TaxID=1475485 RepID=A0ABY6YXH6_9BACL|nr:DUF1003 domain-containing protein [Alicyclobacillus dauci]WAH35062.1 DUF1003 domain-containing protein [Alicyclobacillus dauci]